MKEESQLEPLKNYIFVAPMWRSSVNVFDIIDYNLFCKRGVMEDIIQYIIVAWIWWQLARIFPLVHICCWYFEKICNILPRLWWRE